MSRQEQRAGDNAMQVLAARDVHIGLSSADVVEIVHNEVRRVIAEVSSVAQQVAEERVRALGDGIVERFQDRPELFDAFADPDFQYALSDAGRAAASNDDEHTEQLLVDLLTNRAECGSSSRVRLTTGQAIRAADKLSLDGLRGLTAMWACAALRSTFAGTVLEIATAREVSTALINFGLPEDDGWLDEADALGLVRIYLGGLAQRTSYKELLLRRMTRVLVSGIDADAERELIDAATAAFPELMAQCQPHPLKPGFVLLPGETGAELLEKLDGRASTPELDRLIGTHGYSARDPGPAGEVERQIAEASELSTMASWWDSLRPAELSLVGSVIGFVNARRHIHFHGATTVSELLSRQRTAQ